MNWHADYSKTWDHPHRNVIVEAFRQFRFGSVCEVGCASGPNLVRLFKEWPRLEIGGVDVSESAIACAREIFPKGIFDVRPMDDLFFSDSSVDMVLSDMAAIYVSPLRIGAAVKEIGRIARKGVVLCEFYHPSRWRRIALWLATGYFAHDWPKILEQNDFYDITIRKLKEEEWPGGYPQSIYGYVFSAKTLKTV